MKALLTPERLQSYSIDDLIAEMILADTEIEVTLLGAEIQRRQAK